MRRNLKTISFIGAAVLLLAASASAGKERAAAERGLCPDTFCVFTETDYGGQEVDVTKIGLSNKVDNKIHGLASSLINDRESAALFYAKRDGRGRTFCLNSGDGLTHLADVSMAGFSSTRLLERRSCFPHH